MRLSHDLPCRFARLVFAIAMAFTWAGGADRASSQVAPVASGSGEELNTKAAVDRLERCMRAIEAVRRDVPRETWDVAAVAASAGNDPAALLAWVRDNTVWVPYRGALRGPLGVLMDRRGNSLDRATLLAEFLRTRGKSVRLVRTELPEAVARELQKQISFTLKAPPEQPKPTGRKVIDELQRKYAEPFGIQPANLGRAAEDLVTRSERLSEEIAQRTAEQSKTLASMLWQDEKSEPASAPASLDDVLGSLRDHWWVQVRDGDAWLDLDPLFSTGAPAQQRPAPLETVDWQITKGRLPLDAMHCHEVEVRVIIERWESGRVTEETILRQPLRPAELFGTHIELSHAAQGWPEDLDLSRETDPPGKLKSLASEQKEWLPMLRVGESAYYEGTFTDAGRVNPKADLALFKKSGKAVGGAGSAAANLLDAGPAPVPAPTAASYLTAEWIEYEVRVPGEQPRRSRRQVFDVLGPAARAASQGIIEPVIDGKARLARGLALLGQTQILPLACQLSPAFVDELLARNALAMREPLRKLYEARSDAEAKGPAQALRVLPPLPSRLYDLALAREFLNPHKDDVYLDRPNVLSLHQSLRADAEGGVVFGIGIDIVANELAVRPNVEAPSRVRLVQGVLDTAVETLLMDEVARVTNVSDMLAAQPDAQSWLLVRNKNDPAWIEANVPKDERARVEADLAAGYAVVLPRQAASGGRSTPGWWRVDPATGHTLGIDGHGRGAAMIEYTLNFTIVFAVCLAGGAAAGKAGGSTPSGERDVAGNRRAVIICAFVGIGFAAMAPMLATTSALKVIIGGVATGAAGGYAL